MASVMASCCVPFVASHEGDARRHRRGGCLFKRRGSGFWKRDDALPRGTVVDDAAPLDPQVYHDLWISLLLFTHVRLVLINSTTYESIKGRRWVDNSVHGRPFYARYALNCYRFFCHPRAGELAALGRYERVPTQVRPSFPSL